MTRAETYQCTITRNDDGGVVAFTVEAHDLNGDARSVRVNGYRAIHVVSPMQEILRAAGVSGRQWTQSIALSLAPRDGAHAELLLRAVKPLQRIDRIATVAISIAAMSREEASYWHAQASRRRGLRALRVLIDEGN